GIGRRRSARAVAPGRLSLPGGGAGAAPRTRGRVSGKARPPAARRGTDAGKRRLHCKRRMMPEREPMRLLAAILLLPLSASLAVAQSGEEPASAAANQPAAA